MGTRGNCCAPIKKALSRSSDKKKGQNHKSRDQETTKPVHEASHSPVRQGIGGHDEAYTVALATAAAAEAAAAVAQAAAEVVRIATSTRHSGRLREEAAAIKIQTAFRGYSARRALRCLRGLARMKVYMEGGAVKSQVKTSLQRTHTYTMLQSQIRSRRTNNYENNQVLQRRFHFQREKELKASMGGEWDESTQSKQQIEAKLLHKHEAAIRRERALAYALIHQQQRRKINRVVNHFFTDPSNPQWGWSWLERWMAAVSGDTQDINDSQSSKSPSKNSMQAVQKSFPLRSHNIDKYSPKSVKLSPTPRQRSPISTTGKSKLVLTPPGRKGEGEDDVRSVKSLQFERYRRHSIGGSSARDDGSQTSTFSIPGYMASTASTRAKSRVPSPSREGSETPCKRSLDSPRRRLQFGPSPSRSGRSSSAPRMRT